MLEISIEDTTDDLDISSFFVKANIAVRENLIRHLFHPWAVFDFKLGLFKAARACCEKRVG